MRAIFCLSAIFLAGVALGAKSYEGYKVLRTERLSQGQAQALFELQVNNHELDFWKDPRKGQASDIMASPDQLTMLEDFLKANDIAFSAFINNVETLRQNSQTSTKSKSGFDWNDYYDHDKINVWLDSLTEASNGMVTTQSIGKSYEGRDMRIAKIEEAGRGAPNVWIEAGIHAREWIATAMGTYLINELMSDKAANLRKNINFYILPCANPDGYQYSRDHDRYWRKNRSPQGGCKGVDLNRNWGYHWGEAGVSTNPCSDIYCGTSPASEIETQNIMAFVNSLDPVPALGHCLHSYSQLWLWPYGYGYNQYPDNREEIEQLAKDAADAVYGVHGVYFDPINSADLYPAAGAADDWYKGTLGARYAFTTELRDTGHYGFVLPADQIIPSGEELWAGMEVVFNKIIADNAKEQ